MLTVDKNKTASARYLDETALLDSPAVVGTDLINMIIH